MASSQRLRKTLKSLPPTAALHSADPLRLHKKKQKSISLQNQWLAAPRSTINSTSRDRTNKQPHTNERKSLCLNQYSVLQPHTARLNELFSSFKVKASQPRKFRCLCLTQAAHVTLVTLKRQRRQRAQRPVQLPAALPAAWSDCWPELAPWRFPASVPLSPRVQLWRRLVAGPSGRGPVGSSAV